MAELSLYKLSADLNNVEEQLINTTEQLNTKATLDHTHNLVTTLENGLMSKEDKIKLNSITSGAAPYTHPTGDGNLHVPATDTINAGKVLTAGATPGSLSWEALPETTPTEHTHTDLVVDRIAWGQSNSFEIKYNSATKSLDFNFI